MSRITHRESASGAKKSKKILLLFLLLQLLICIFAFRAVLAGQWENFFTCLLALILLFIPSITERSLRLSLPSGLEALAYLLVFCSAVLGEIGNYYQRFSFWDSLLHTVNGFIFAAFGFCLADVLEQSDRAKFRLSPLFLSIVSFCFSMTVGVFWEFLEYTADALLGTDMQKDTFLHTVHTVSLPNDMGEKVTHIRDITQTILVTADGETVTYAGFLDIGITDTVKDLFVNFLGAAIFSVIGYVYVKRRGKGVIAKQFIPVLAKEEETPPEA